MLRTYAEQVQVVLSQQEKMLRNGANDHKHKSEIFLGGNFVFCFTCGWSLTAAMGNENGIMYAYLVEKPATY